ncbi:32416_t:CDS:2, partial [Racocetra persica]
ITEHMISIAAYEDLVKILKHSDFWPEHVIANIRPSTKHAYLIMPVDYIEYILNNLTIVPNLYFGPGIVYNEKREFWHCTLWQNSSLFGETKLFTYQADNFLCYHQDKAIKFTRICSVVEVNKRQLLRADLLVPYSGLLGYLCSMNRKAHEMNIEELWLVEEQECLIIPENITQINVWLKDLDRPVEYEYFVTEILYSFNSNDLASMFRHNANYGCRTCSVSSSQLTNSNFDFVANACFYYLTNIQYNEIAHQQTNSACQQLSSQYRLSAKPVLDTLYWDRHLQSPQNAYYTLAVVEAKLLKLAFSTTMTNNTYKELHSLFEKERIGFLKIFSDIFENLPNVHINVYLPQHARTFATLVNTSVEVKEIVHRIYKNMVPHTNYKNIELDLLRRYNTSFALTHLFDEFFDYISYTIIENDRKLTRLKFHVGEIIEIKEENEGFTYAKIQ